MQPLTKSSNCRRPSVISRRRTSSDKNLQIVESSVFSRSRTRSDKNLQIVESSQYLVEVVLIPKCITQEEQMGLFSCH